ncbi:HIT domain-containing protein [Microbacterium hominis]|uniref:HIT family protein n=1 Tax=Microbacterium hominis TaxID=162426 RepID=UPI00168A9A11|nr:HIT domain-containing protein [Microbacterium hominis]QOC24821.1 HIT domain-containing protein [Microbacterium hominis]QOC28874.1 HIT domain-containing protein [Microbacterium hominis]
MIGIENCPFCARISAGDYDGSWLGAVHFEPLNPVTPGHRLFVTRGHEGPLENPYDHEPYALRVRAERGMRTNKARGLDAVLPLFYMWRREERITEPFNLILNAGAEASQTIEHLHMHYLPRRADDGLVLPWTNQGTGDPS